MNRKQRSTKDLTLIIELTIILVSAAVTSAAGTTGMAFLKMGVGARAVGMGGAYVSVPGDQTASYWNPAGLASISGREFVLMHNEWFQGIRHEYAGVAFGDGTQTLSLSLAISTAGELERRVGPRVKPLGTFGVYDLALSFSYAQALKYGIDLGVTGKILHEKIHVESSSGVALDFGVFYRSPIEGLNFGFSARNLGRTGKLKDESINLPVDWRFGVSYLLPSPSAQIALLTSLDLRIPNDFEESTHAGLECQLSDILYLRLGYQTGNSAKDISAGFGLKYGAWRIDYAFVPFGFDLGNTHRISVGRRS